MKAVAVPLHPRPDLAVVSFDGARTVSVQNLGTADAVFSALSPLLSFGDVQVPAGGKISPGQTVEVHLSLPWACPDSLYCDWQYLSFAMPWGYALPQPLDADGRRVLLVDPNGAVSESDESNNVFLARKPNSFRPVGAPALPDLRVVAVKVWLDSLGTQKLLRWDYKIQNLGTGAAFICDNRALSQSDPVYMSTRIANVKIDGKLAPQNSTFAEAPWILAPGETKEMWDFDKIATVDQFGVMTPGIQPGCHEIVVTADPGKTIRESNECDNATTTYFATGGVTCAPNQPSTLKVSDCVKMPGAYTVSQKAQVTKLPSKPLVKPAIKPPPKP
jgi:hypothetical protein